MMKGPNGTSKSTNRGVLGKLFNKIENNSDFSIWIS